MDVCIGRCIFVHTDVRRERDTYVYIYIFTYLHIDLWAFICIHTYKSSGFAVGKQDKREKNVPRPLVAKAQARWAVHQEDHHKTTAPKQAERRGNRANHESNWKCVSSQLLLLHQPLTSAYHASLALARELPLSMPSTPT